MRDRGYDGGLGLAQPASGAQELERAEAMRLLASIGYGRVVFTLNALPAIRPVNHLVDDGRVDHPHPADLGGLHCRAIHR